MTTISISSVILIGIVNALWIILLYVLLSKQLRNEARKERDLMLKNLQKYIEENQK